MSRRFSLVVTLSVGVAVALLLSGAAGTLDNGRQDPWRSAPVPLPSGQTSTLLPDGRWLFLGGEGPSGPLATATLWDPHTATLTTVAHSLQFPRAWHSATVLPDGTVLILGGLGADGQAVAAAEVFAPDTQIFTSLLTPSVTPRVFHSTTLLTDGRVLIVGGVATTGERLNTAELWDPQTRTGEVMLGTLHTARWHHRATLLPDGTVLVHGGQDDAGTVLADSEVYDPDSQDFTASDVPSSIPHSALPNPQLIASLPEDGASHVPLDSLIALRFSQPLQVETVNTGTVTLTGPRGAEAITVTPAEGGMLAFILPDMPLHPGTTYTLSLDGPTDETGFALPVTILSFTTVSVLSTTRQSAQSGQTQKQPTPDDKDDDEDWILGAKNFKGDWRSGRLNSPMRELPPLQAEPGITALAGQVLTLNGKPLAGVTLQIEGMYGAGQVTARTDETGRFLLTDIMSGWCELLIDGRTASKGGKTYGVFEVGVEVIAGQTNVLSYTIWMPQIDTKHAVTISSPTTTEVVITTPYIPGLELHLPLNTVIRDHEGNVVTQLSITPIPVDRPPFPLPEHVEVPIYFTIQPGGAYLVGASKGSGAWLVYPNYVGAYPGARFDFWYYDPEEFGWSIYGQGTVTVDGKQVIPDPEVRIYEFTGAMINGGGSPPPPGPPPCDDPCCGGPGGGPGGGAGSGAGGGGGSDGDPCDLSTGLFLLRQTDLFLPDILPIEITRIYRTQDSNTRPFGIGMTHPYAIFLWSANQYQEADLVLPDGGRVHYVRVSPGTGYIDAVFEHTSSPTHFYKSLIMWNPVRRGWDLTLKDGTVYTFGESSVQFGQNAALQSIRDRNGNTVVVTRANGQYGNITQVTSPHGRWIKFSYDTSNRITQATDNSGRTVSYLYNTSGRLWKVTDPTGGVTEYTYDTAGRMAMRKDARGNIVVTNQYDANGRVSRQALADGGVYQFAYTTDANGKITQMDVTDPRGMVRRVTENASGYLLTDTRAFGRPEQQTTTYEREAGSNRVLAMTDSLGRRTAYTYDALGNVTSITRLAGTAEAVTTSLTYESMFNQVASITDPLGHTTTFTYDSKGRLIRRTDLLGNQTNITYNAAGQPIAITDPLGNTTQLSYRLGDLATITDPLGNTTTRLTDLARLLLTLPNPLGQQTQYSYDALNRLLQTTDPLGAVTAFAYDANSNLLSVTDARNGVTQYTYDTKDRVATRKDPLLRQESFQYDGRDNLTQTTDRKAQVTSVTYDGLNRRTQVTYADGSTKTYTYDAGNRVTQIVDSVSGTVAHTYDNLDRLLSETTSQGTVSYTYDAAGRRTSMTIAGQPTVTYTYDNANRLTQITQDTSTVTFTYDAASRRTSLTLPNGVVVEYSYDVASRPTGMTYKQGATVLGDLTYTYDKAGRRIAMGGSFARTGLPQALSTATYDAANQQLGLGDKSIAYDLNGNLSSLTDPAGTTTYTWNARNQLTALSGPWLSASFQYDALGRRVSKTINNATTGLLYDGVNSVQELTDGTPVANLLTGLGIDEYLTRTDSAGTQSFLTDALGSILALADASGVVQTEYAYEPFGRTTVSGASSANPFQYTGRENDGTGLYYYRARYYHPVLQRFISEDPIGFLGGDINLYGYVGNNPVNVIDPYGLSQLVFDRGDRTLYVYPGDANTAGPPQAFPAGNNTVNPTGDPLTPESFGPAPEGTFPIGPVDPRDGGPNGPYGPGIAPITLPKGPHGQRTGVGVHGGRENRGGPQHPTRGCIRTTNEGTRSLMADPPTRITIQE